MKYQNTSNALIRIFVNGKVKEISGGQIFEADHFSGPACVVAIGGAKKARKKKAAPVTTTLTSTTVEETVPAPRIRKSRKTTEQKPIED